MRRALQFAAALLPTIAAARLGGQQGGAPAFAVRFTVAIDSAGAGKRYLAHPRDTILARLTVEDLTRYLQIRLDQVENRTVVLASGGQPAGGPGSSLYTIACRVRLDGLLRLDVGCGAQLAGDTVVVWHPPAIPIGRSIDTTDLLKTTSDPDLNHALRSIADWSSGAVQEEIYEWVTESTVKIRVFVDSFASLITPVTRELGPLLRQAFEGELTQSAAIFVVTGVSGRAASNYRIVGNYSVIGPTLRIDVRCIKRGPEDRILASRYTLVDTADAPALSAAVRDLAHELRHSMEADFRHSLKTLAVVAMTGSEAFAVRRPSRRETSIAREVQRTAALRLQALSGAETRDSTAPLRLQVLSDLLSVERYTSAPLSPSEILAEQRADYLLLLIFQDLGERVRLTAELHSFDVERPAVGVLIGERQIDLFELDRVLDDLLLGLVREMRRRNLADSSDAVVRWRLRSVPLRNLERPHRLALRVGTTMHRVSPALFLGRQSGTSFEASYTVRVARSRKAGGRYDLGLEILGGLEATSLVKAPFSFAGPSTATALLNARVTITPWEYSSTSLNISLGAGVGMQGLRYRFHPGDLDYSGTATYRETEFSPAVDVFGSLHFDIPELHKMEFDVTTRWLWGLERITRFQSLPLARFAGGNGPTGRLGGLNLAWGIAYVF